MSKKSLSSQLSAAALSLTLIGGTATLADAEANPNTQNSATATQTSYASNGAALTRKYPIDALKQKYETWTVNAPAKAERVMEKFNSLPEDKPFAKWMEPRDVYKAPWGKGITLRDVDRRNEGEMRDGNMLAVVAVFVPPGSQETEWFQQTDAAKRVREVQAEMFINNAATSKENGGLIEFVYMVQQPEDQPIVVDGVEYESKDAIVIMMGDQLPVVEYTPRDASSMAYAMFDRGMHIQAPFYYPSGVQLAADNSAEGSAGDTTGGSEQEEAPYYATLDQ